MGKAGRRWDRVGDDEIREMHETETGGPRDTRKPRNKVKVSGLPVWQAKDCERDAGVASRDIADPIHHKDTEGTEGAERLEIRGSRRCSWTFAECGKSDPRRLARAVL